MDLYSKQISILYVEDENDVREGFAKTLKRYTKEQYIACDGKDAIELYKKFLPDIVISDIKMPNKNGIELAREILQINPEQIIIFTTAHTESKYTLEALEMQVEAYLLKPIDKNKFKNKLNKISRNILYKRENLKNQKIIQAIFDTESNMIVLTDFIDIRFASKSFLSLFNIVDKEDFSLRYKKLIDIFKNPQECSSKGDFENYIFGENKDKFLQEYKKYENPKVCLYENNNIYQININEININNDILYSISLVDITVLHTQKIEALYEASHDKLTLAYNKSMYDKLLDKEYKRYLRYKRPLCLAIFDIDHFKNINDSFGHLVGDRVLKVLAGFFIKHIREIDTFARWGGEEFVLLMSEINLDEAKIVCEKLREGIEQIKMPLVPKFTVSAGLVQIDEEDSKEDFFKKADDALYVAKNSGRNKVVTYKYFNQKKNINLE